jgi:hypothetical protein
MSYGSRHNLKSDARNGASASVTLVWIQIPRIQSSALYAFWVPLMCFGHSLEICPDTIFGLLFAKVTAATTTRPLPWISAAALSHFSLAWQGIHSRHSAQSGRYKEHRFSENVCVYQGG